MNATESEYEPVSDYEGEGAVSDYEARSEFDDTDEWDKDKSMSKRSARVRVHSGKVHAWVTWVELIIALKSHRQLMNLGAGAVEVGGIISTLGAAGR